jgi:anti-sigma B factor antagonist
METLGNDGVTAEVTVGDDRSAIVRVAGEIDVATIDSVHAAVAAAAEQGPDRIVFDLSGVVFMDSSGIAALLQARKLVAAVQIRNPSKVVLRLIAVTGLVDILPVEP